MKITWKTWYSIGIVWAILCIPIIEFGVFPYDGMTFAYALGQLSVPVIGGGIAKLFKATFQNTFNVLGTMLFVSAVMQQFIN
jgi:hypothetical protein